jgi:hypothetical protein
MKNGFADDQKLYQRRAKEALPLLVARAKAGRTITYGQLAKQLHMPNPRNLNYVLGTIGRELQALNRTWKEPIPPIQCLVINKTKLTPGRGIGFHMPYKKFQQLTPLAKRQVLQTLHVDIFGYPNWGAVLQHFKITPVIPADVLDALAPKARYGKAGGEGEDHRILKAHLLQHPELLNLPLPVTGQEEYAFLSADRIDLLFQHQTTWIGVEVKGVTSDDADLLRGIFQCVKYRALIEAAQRYEQQAVDARILLAIGGGLSHCFLDSLTS